MTSSFRSTLTKAQYKYLPPCQTWCLSWEQTAELPSNITDIPMQLFFTHFGNTGGTELAGELYIVLLEAQPVGSLDGTTKQVVIFYLPFSRAKVFLLDHQAFGLFWPSFPLNQSKEPISAYGAEPHWKTISAEPILSHSHDPNSTMGDTQEATASLCQTGQTYQRMLSCLCLLGAFSRWHIASDLETLLLTPLIRRSALQHRMGYPAQVQAVPWGPTLRLPSFSCLLYRIIGNMTQYHLPKQQCKGLAIHL